MGFPVTRRAIRSARRSRPGRSTLASQRWPNSWRSSPRTLASEVRARSSSRISPESDQHSARSRAAQRSDARHRRETIRRRAALARGKISEKIAFSCRKISLVRARETAMSARIVPRREGLARGLERGNPSRLAPVRVGSAAEAEAQRDRVSNAPARESRLPRDGRHPPAHGRASRGAREPKNHLRFARVIHGKRYAASVSEIQSEIGRAAQGSPGERWRMGHEPPK